MGARSTARESALQILYAMDTAGHGVDQAISDFWSETPGDGEGRAYSEQLVRGVDGARTELDEMLALVSAHWRIERMTRVDRNVLRLGAFELRYSPEVPRAVILDEAVELAKRYGTEESGSFVNGVLDKVADSWRLSEPGANPSPVA
jgi:transcription antitermination protein NusB